MGLSNHLYIGDEEMRFIQIGVKYPYIHDGPVKQQRRQHMSTMGFRQKLGVIITITFALSIAACAPEVSLNDSLVKPYSGELNQEQQTAQTVALSYDELKTVVVDPTSGKTLRSEVFGIYPARQSDLSQGSDRVACPGKECYRVDVYNYATNTTISIIVNVTKSKVVEFVALESVQPEVPPYLADKAIKIASTSPEVAKALGFDPSKIDPVMYNLKTSLKNTACEISGHLCVAPTFIVGNRGLWAIVDLTDERLVGVRWTDMGESAGGYVTQQTLTYEQISANYCEKVNTLEQGSWQFDYILTSSDGINLTNVRFQSKPVISNVKLVDWHVSYSHSDKFGYSDAIGCPLFSSASVLASGAPIVESILRDGQNIGFSFTQDFMNAGWPKTCNYRYQQRFEFFSDGSFRILAINIGHGCGNNGTYRPNLRIQFPTDIAYNFSSWDGSDWKPWKVEQWQQQSDTYTPRGAQFRIISTDGTGYEIAPGNGQPPDDKKSDQAFVYVTRYHHEEGEADLLTLGNCCNTDFHQGPELFINEPPEPIANSPLVMWYVAQMAINDTPGSEYCWADTKVENGMYIPVTWPCYAGLLFKPVQP